MTFFRIYHWTNGGHVDLRVFVGDGPEYTLGKCGDLCMEVEQFEYLKDKLLLADVNVEFVPQSRRADPSLTQLQRITAARDKIERGDYDKPAVVAHVVDELMRVLDLE